MKPVVTFLSALFLVIAFQAGYRLLARIFRHRMHLERYEWAIWFWIMTLVMLATCGIFHSDDPKDVILWTPMALVAVIHIYVLSQSTDDFFSIPSEFKTFSKPNMRDIDRRIAYNGVHPRKRLIDSKVSPECPPQNRRHRANRTKPVHEGHNETQQSEIRPPTVPSPPGSGEVPRV